MSIRKLFRDRRPAGFFSLLLALFGFGTTECCTPRMYGSPNAEWTVKGKVTDEDNNPVPGLQVVLGDRLDNGEGPVSNETYRTLDTLRTQADGTYSVSRYGFPVQTLQVDIHDIDGADNGGQFEDASVIIRNIENGGGKGGYSGHTEIDVPDIIVKKK